MSLLEDLATPRRVNVSEADEIRQSFSNTGRGHQCCQTPVPSLDSGTSTSLALLQSAWHANGLEANRLIIARGQIDSDLDRLRQRQHEIMAEGKRLLFPCLTDGGEVRLEGGE